MSAPIEMLQIREEHENVNVDFCVFIVLLYMFTLGLVHSTNLSNSVSSLVVSTALSKIPTYLDCSSAGNAENRD